MLLAMAWLAWVVFGPAGLFALFCIVILAAVAVANAVGNTTKAPPTVRRPTKPKSIRNDASAQPIAAESMTKEQLLRRFRKELREGVIDEDEFEALRDIYEF